MKFMLNFLILLFASSYGQEQQHESNVSSLEVKEEISADVDVLFKRNTLLVADLERSLKVYKDILGFSFSGEISALEEDSYAYGMFKIPMEGKIRFIALNSPSQERTIALTEVTNVTWSKPINTMLSSCMVLRVNDFETVMQKIEGLGLETSELQVVEKENYTVLEQAFYDFDGHLVDLYSIKTKKQ
ncbi:MAG: VOC family protein [Maribacter sp.]|uniref:VOC family protein n=1 Tax=Maribacter sp. TaxID=1897614 RepID=UPI003298D606